MELLKEDRVIVNILHVKNQQSWEKEDPKFEWYVKELAEKVKCLWKTSRQHRLLNNNQCVGCV